MRSLWSSPVIVVSCRQSAFGCPFLRVAPKGHQSVARGASPWTKAVTKTRSPGGAKSNAPIQNLFALPQHLPHQEPDCRPSRAWIDVLPSICRPYGADLAPRPHLTQMVAAGLVALVLPYPYPSPTHRCAMKGALAGTTTKLEVIAELVDVMGDSQRSESHYLHSAILYSFFYLDLSRRFTLFQFPNSCSCLLGEFPLRVGG